MTRLQPHTTVWLDPMDCAADLDPVVFVEQAGAEIILDESAVRAILAEFNAFYAEHPERTRRYTVNGTSFVLAGRNVVDLSVTT